jgi:hypothetical protein
LAGVALPHHAEMGPGSILIHAIESGEDGAVFLKRVSLPDDTAFIVMPGRDPRLSGLISLYKRHGVDASGSGSGDSGSVHEREITPWRTMIPSGSGSHPAARAIALPDF